MPDQAAHRRGRLVIMSLSGGLKLSAVAGRPSVTRFTHNSCTGFSTSGKPAHQRQCCPSVFHLLGTELGDGTTRTTSTGIHLDTIQKGMHIPDMQVQQAPGCTRQVTELDMQHLSSSMLLQCRRHAGTLVTHIELSGQRQQDNRLDFSL